MNEVLMDKVDRFSESMLLHYASPNRDLVAEILMFDAAHMSQLDHETLCKYVFVLGQYLVMLQYNSNVKDVEYSLISKAFEHKMNSARFSMPEMKGGTAKERNAWLMLNVPELEELNEKLTVAEAEKMLISGMVKAVEGLLNALKKNFTEG